LQLQLKKLLISNYLDYLSTKNDRFCGHFFFNGNLQSPNIDFSSVSSVKPISFSKYFFNFRFFGVVPCFFVSGDS